MGKAWFGPGAEGPPGCAHGGSMAAVLDEAMGAAAWMNGNMVVVQTLSVEFRAPLRLRVAISIEAAIRRHEGRRLYIEGALIGPSRKIYAEAHGVFVRVNPRRLTQKGC